MKKSKWLDCQGNEFFPKLKGTPSLVKIEHKNTATLYSARSKKKYKVAVLQLKAKVMRSQAPTQAVTDTPHEAWCALDKSDATVLTGHRTCMAG